MVNENSLWFLNKNISEGFYPVSKAYREEPHRPEDTGWRLLCDGDTEELLNDVKHAVVLSTEEIIELEPGLIKLLDYPVGSEVEISFQNDELVFTVTNSN